MKLTNGPDQWFEALWLLHDYHPDRLTMKDRWDRPATQCNTNPLRVSLFMPHCLHVECNETSHSNIALKTACNPKTTPGNQR